MTPIQPRVTVAQIGARHAYAIPSAFAGSGALERFYTDACGNVGLGGCITRVGTALGSRGAAARLASRAVPPSVRPVTRTFERFAWDFARGIAGANPSEGIRARDAAFERFGELVIRSGLGEATHFYSVMNEAGPAAAAAREKGLIVGADVCITPSWDILMRAEQERFPDWERPSPTLAESLGSGVRHFRHMLDNCHVFVSPSQAVTDDLVTNHGVARDKTRLVPYALAPHWFDIVSRPEPKRILFAGSANMRKGIHHLAGAAHRLVPHGYTFVVAGEADERIRSHPDAAALTFLGRVPRRAVAAEFGRADIFVLPSIAEGSAGVTYEAMAAGVPIVVSAAAGSVARDGIDGSVMAEPDAESLAEAIDRIAADRALRARMSGSARERAQEYSWEQFTDRLTAAVEGAAA
jgi:glycosyltransferase involved in cell wall biosynthesis